MKKIILSIFLMATAYAAHSHKVRPGIYDDILFEIEMNSTTLEALRKQSDAQKLGSRTGLYLSNPEVEFGYMWGSPAALGQKTSISVTQSFDFPTAYSHRSNISKLTTANVEQVYLAERQDILLRAKRTCIELVYYSALAKVYSERLEMSRGIEKTYAAKLKSGDTNAIEYNKARLNLSAVENHCVQIEAERSSLLAELKALNGGKNIVFDMDSYPYLPIASDFEEWYLQVEEISPALKYLRTQVEISQHQAKLDKALSLPKFSAGYMYDKGDADKFQGVKVGVSIPLWENKNKVKYAKAQVKANEMVLEDSKMQFYNRLQSLHVKALSLGKSAANYRSAIDSYNNDMLLRKALGLGEISLLTYLQESEFYYDAVTNALDTEKDYELTLAELLAVTL